MNRAEIMGGVTKDAEVKVFDSGAMKMNFSVAVAGVKYNSRTKSDEVSTTFIPVEAWLTDPNPGDADLLYKGDKVYVFGEITQYQPPGEDRAHTRVLAHWWQVVKRGRAGQAAIGGTQRPEPRQDAVPPQADPWATPAADAPAY